MGCDYRVPVMHGLLDKTYVNKMKTSPSYSATSFALEYLSYWLGSDENSWFNSDKMLQYRRIKNPETHAIFRAGANQFYLISVDVGRLHDQTVACVFRVNIDSGNKYFATLVNIKLLSHPGHLQTMT